nr:glycoside hydrolase family 3 C-terminal domain-containing protein [Atopobiaceae bacterium]
VIFAALAIAANVASSMFKPVLDHYVGAAPTTVQRVEGSEDWDANYYDAQYRGRSAATGDAEALVTEIEAEGIVLLKNDGVLPLDPSSTTVSLLGRYAADPVYGGAGSGTVDPASCVNFYQGITGAGFTVNDTAYNWIADNFEGYAKANITMDDPTTACYYIGEIPWADYSSEAQSSISGTTAVIVLGRGGGEGGDLSRDLLGDVNSGVSTTFKPNAETANYVEGQHELELTVEEKSLIEAAKANCDNVVVVINASTTMELGPLVEEGGPYEVNAIIDAGSIGATGARAVGQVLSGEVNPSGRTTDIWAADFTADPTFGNFGGKQYTDVSGYYAANANNTPAEGTAYFVEYEEGIYMGYRYYETAAVEAEAGNYAGFDYDSAVVFPFGYGLSYTTFEQTLDSVEVAGESVVATVTVTNTGDVAGKSVVEIYYTAPYTPGGIEKSAVVLGDFAKTDLLAPGESQTITLTFAVRDMASYSTADAAYVLDAGTYVISLRSDSHNVIAEESLELDAQTYNTDSATEAEIANQFDDLTAYMEANCENLSRADFAGTFPVAAEDKPSESCGIEFVEWDVNDHEDPDAVMPTTGAANGLSLIDLRGKPYDDPAWDQLLDQLTPQEMATALNDSAYTTGEIASIGKPATHDPDGPAGFTSLTGSTGNCAYCSEYVMAQTWNTELMYRVGQMIGQEALASGYNGWYAPAMNTHRSPFAGRNFEYYSEDPLLAGKIASAVITGAAENGVYSYIKHFALNDQESYRVQHVCTWANEQAVRELYLRPFEICVKDSTYEMRYISDDQGTVSTVEMPACTAVMSSFNYIGTIWAGGRESLITGILRDEWGFQGCVITDFNLYGYMNKDQALAAGTDLELTYSAMTGNYNNINSPSVVSRLREATHHVLFTVVNSNAMQGMAPGSKILYGTAPWQYLVYGVTALMVLLIALMAFLMARNAKANKLFAAAAAADGAEVTEAVEAAEETAAEAVEATEQAAETTAEAVEAAEEAAETAADVPEPGDDA